MNSLRLRSFVIKYLMIFALICLLVFVDTQRFKLPFIGIEDANIFFVYAMNIAGGHGFVYNIGGEKVEGFTSLLWVLICAFAFKISAYPELLLLLVSGILVSLGLAVALSYIESALLFRSGAIKSLNSPVIFLALLFSMPAYMIWNVITLMDSAIWSTLLLITTVVVIRAQSSPVRKTNIILSGLLILLLVTRPEAMLWDAVFILGLFAVRLSNHRLGRAIKSIGIPIACYIATLGGLMLFRLEYFGFPLPNTFYAKVSPSILYDLGQGSLYLAGYFISNPIIAVCILAVLFTAADSILGIYRKKKLEDGRMLLPFFAVTGLLIPVIWGGDPFESFRFYQMIYPILLLCVLYGIKHVFPRSIPQGWRVQFTRPRRRIATGLLIFVLIGAQAFYWIKFERGSELGFVHQFYLAEEGRKTGDFMTRFFSELPDYPKVGHISAGGMKFSYRGEILDLLGLNNTGMAHNQGKRLGRKSHAAFEKSTFYELKPDVVCPYLVRKATWIFDENRLRASRTNMYLKNIYDDAKFQGLYVFAKLEDRRADQIRALCGWFSRSFLSELSARNICRIETFEFEVRAVDSGFGLVLITVDALRPDYLGINGYDKNISPAMDGLVSEGLYFSKAITPLPRTTQSLASLLTGCLPHKTKVRNLWDPLSGKIPTLAEILRESGYQTLAVVSNHILSPDRGLGRGFDVYDYGSDKRDAIDTTKAVLKHIQKIDLKKPFFIWVHYIDPHVPYYPPEALALAIDPGYDGKYRTHFGDKKGGIGDRAYPKDLGKEKAVYHNDLGQKVNQHIRRLYAADIQFTDMAIGRLLSGLEDSGSDNMMVVLTADHGESLGEHDYYFDHGDSVYNAELRVPLAFVLPRNHPLYKTGTVDDWVSLADVLPTLSALMETDVSSNHLGSIDGVSLIPYWRRTGEAPKPRWIFAEAGECFFPKSAKRRVQSDIAGRPRCAIFNDWKLIWTPFQRPELLYELYNTAEDAGETKSLYDPSHPVFKTMEKVLRDWLDSQKRDVRETQPNQKDLKILRSLGYIK